MNIALFGGKFDPPHLGHKNLIDQIFARLKFIDEVWVIPAKTHQWRKMYATGQDRLKMLKYWETDRIKVLDLELKRKKKTITIDTIKILKEKYSDYNFFWICGADTCPTFHNWDDHDQLIKLMKFYVYPRPGFPLRNLPEGFSLIPGMRLPKRDFSSTEIRNAIAKEQNMSRWLSPEIANYIHQNKLYLLDKRTYKD